MRNKCQLGSLKIGLFMNREIGLVSARLANYFFDQLSEVSLQSEAPHAQSVTPWRLQGNEI